MHCLARKSCMKYEKSIWLVSVTATVHNRIPLLHKKHQICLCRHSKAFFDWSSCCASVSQDIKKINECFQDGSHISQWIKYSGVWKPFLFVYRPLLWSFFMCTFNDYLWLQYHYYMNHISGCVGGVNFISKESGIGKRSSYSYFGCFIHFLTDALGKGMNPSHLSAMS